MGQKQTMMDTRMSKLVEVSFAHEFLFIFYIAMLNYEQDQLLKFNRFPVGC